MILDQIIYVAKILGLDFLPILELSKVYIIRAENFRMVDFRINA